MANKYFVIVDHRDHEKFRRFQYDIDKEKLKQILNNDKLRIWAFSNQHKEVFTEIRKGDMIYFAEENDSKFSLCGKVFKKENDSDFAIQLWGNDFRTKMMTDVVCFDEFSLTSISYREMLRSGGFKIENPIPGIYKIHEMVEEHLQPLTNDQTDSEHLDLLPVDISGPPPKANANVIRYIRDTEKSRRLKKKYQNRCQVCNYRLEVDKNKHYSEVHHIRPLGKGGDDDYNNMIVLCPTHHAEFDYKIIAIGYDGKTIIDKNKKKISDLHLKSDHEIAQKNITYQLDVMNQK